MEKLEDLANFTETFPALTGEVFLLSPAKLNHSFIQRVPGVEVFCDREEAIARLQPAHEKVRLALGYAEEPFHYAEQVHGRDIQLIDEEVLSEERQASCTHPMVDGLITGQKNVLLGIYVADCCAVYVVDPVQEVIALLHSGKKGTELGILGEAIARMKSELGSRAADLLVQLSPCIRPPAYEIDFAAEIREQGLEAGVLAENIHDAGVCTYQGERRYYSYRREQGKTGRMLALLGMRE